MDIILPLIFVSVQLPPAGIYISQEKGFAED